MAEEIQQYVDWLPPEAQYYIPYLRRGVPPLSVVRLNLELLSGIERERIKTPPLAGDHTLRLSYKGRDGVVASFAQAEEDCVVLQLQGGKQKGYRVTTALNWVDLMADQIVQIATHVESPFRRLTMPELPLIPGLYDGTWVSFDSAQQRYELFAAKVGLRHSKEDRRFIRDLR